MKIIFRFQTIFFGKNELYDNVDLNVDKMSSEWTKDGSEWTQDIIEYKGIVNLQC